MFVDIFFSFYIIFIANSIIAHGRRRCQSQLSAREHLRSSQQTSLPTCNIQISGFFFLVLFVVIVTAYCSHCKLPLFIDVSTREIENRARPRVR